MAKTRFIIKGLNDISNIRSFLTALVASTSLMTACSEDTSSDAQNKNDLLPLIGQEEAVCPNGHKDSIVEIIYGMPSPELFAQEDSGLVALGGCELSDENWYCQIHEISF